MRITRTSLLTGREHTLNLDVTPEQIESWLNGTLIQRAMPHLSESDREFLISGTTDEEWKAAGLGES